MDDKKLTIDHELISSRIADLLTDEDRIGYLTLSENLGITSVSKNLSHLLPRVNEQLIGHKLTDVIWEFIGVEDSLQSIINREAPFFLLDTVNWKMPDESLRYVDIGVYPISEEAPAEGLLLLIQENSQTGILQQKLTQDRNESILLKNQLAKTNSKLERINQLKSIFLSMAAHDMRAPLTSILGFTELVEAALDPDTQQEATHHVSIIKDQVERMDRLISDMLDLDQIEKEKINIKKTNCDLNIVLNEVVLSLNNVAEGKSITVSTEYKTSPLLVFADPDRSRQIIYNLLGNALKYTKSGGKVTISSWEDEKAEAACIKIADTGIGMSQTEVDGLFQLYYRTDRALESSEKGTGIGLYIVKSLLDAQNGEIKVHSTPDEGSDFTIYLPTSLNPVKI